MMHLKNIKMGNPKTKKQYELLKNENITPLFTEDGDDWYEKQTEFSQDTLKVAYLNSGLVAWVGKDVTTIDPTGMSVIELPDITANRRITAPGYWFYRNDGFVFDYSLKAEDDRKNLILKISSKTGEWERDLLLGLISDEDKEKLKAYRVYSKALLAMDLSGVTDKNTYNSIEWPVSPETSS
ncbi:tail fiber assembly protein [Enterobacter ludwigii]|uniref:tail fiber assembly protein n=1 Tax=Enterobacter ludwigii TaxID=299767 RepID=UPI002A821978|nr:tail fiber assembly protein [Enterobacter ludwigii]